MAIQEVTSTGWFGRIGNSIKGIFIGLLLAVVSLVVLVLNERNAVRDIRANKEIAREVVSVSNESVDPAHEGKLVHLNGPAKTDDIVKNPQFGIEENAIRLSWKYQIYQWVERKETKTRKKTGGGEETITTYKYERKWVDSPVNSKKFKEPGGHTNNGKQNYKSGNSQAANVTLGAFTLSKDLISKIRASEPYSFTELPPALQDAGRVENGVFYTGTPGSPVVDDEKLTFTITKPGDVSVMAQQTKDTFSPYVTKNGKTKLLLSDGLLTAEQMVAEEEKKAAILRWALRGGGFFLMFFGFCLVLKPLSVLADVIPFIGNLVGGATAVVSFLFASMISLTVIAISWIFFRPLLGVPLFFAAIACLILIIRRTAKAKHARGPALA